MTIARSSLLVIACLALGLSVVPAHAQLSRTFVSSFGNDANDCNRATPCRTFQRAYSVTLPNGEITVLDPGGYGSVAIFSSVSIINDGVGEAGVLVSGGGIGIFVNAAATDHVSLRGLTIKGIGFGGGNGIRFISAASLSIENCVIRNHIGFDGVEMLGSIAANTRSTLIMSNTIVADNGGNGIYLQPAGSGAFQVVLNRVETYNNAAHGFALASVNTTQSIRGAVTDSVAAGNGLAGFVAVTTGSNGEASLFVKHSLSAFNGTGFSSDFSQLVLTDTATYGNQVGWSTANHGALYSYGDNVVWDTGNAGGIQLPKQ